MSVTLIKPIVDPDPVATFFRVVRDAARSGPIPLAVRISVLELVKQEMVSSALAAIHGEVVP